MGTTKAGLTKNDAKYLAMAAQIAELSQCRFRHGVVVVRHGKVISLSTNLERNNPKNVEARKHASVHAEIGALKKIRYPKKCDTIYVARISNKGARLSKPCDECMAVIDFFGCKAVWTE